MMAALRTFCPNCRDEPKADESVRPGSGFRMAAFDALGCERKFLVALKHPIPETRMLAIQLLCAIRSRSAVAAVATILEREEDPYAH
jgi:hypothetical protein